MPPRGLRVEETEGEETQSSYDSKQMGSQGKKAETDADSDGSIQMLDILPQLLSRNDEALLSDLIPTSDQYVETSSEESLENMKVSGSAEEVQNLGAAAYMMDIDFERLFNDNIDIDIAQIASNPAIGPDNHHELTDTDSSFPPELVGTPVSTASECSTASIPRVLLCPSQEVPHLQISSPQRSLIIVDLLERIPSLEAEVLRLPDARSLSNCLEAYLTSFHLHLPIIHLPTLDLTNESSPLIMIMCAIGALYRLERDRARELYCVAELSLLHESNKYKIVRRAPRWLNDPFQLAWDSPQSEKLQPLWASQCQLLVLMFCSLSGESEKIDKAISELGTCLSVSRFSLIIAVPGAVLIIFDPIANSYQEYRRRLPHVSTHASDRGSPWNWHEWAERESTKRYAGRVWSFSILIPNPK